MFVQLIQLAMFSKNHYGAEYLAQPNFGLG